jgi:hypothetical protein
MAKSILMEELHLTFRMPAGLPAERYAAAVRALRGKRLHRRLSQAVAAAVRPFPSLRGVKVTLSG